MIRKGIIIEIVVIVVFVALAIFMYNYDKTIDLIFFDIYSQKDIDDKGINLAVSNRLYKAAGYKFIEV